MITNDTIADPQGMDTEEFTERVGLEDPVLDESEVLTQECDDHIGEVVDDSNHEATESRMQNLVDTSYTQPLVSTLEIVSVDEGMEVVEEKVEVSHAESSRNKGNGDTSTESKALCTEGLSPGRPSVIVPPAYNLETPVMKRKGGVEDSSSDDDDHKWSPTRAPRRKPRLSARKRRGRPRKLNFDECVSSDELETSPVVVDNSLTVTIRPRSTRAIKPKKYW
jgi:hypothetical protein